MSTSSRTLLWKFATARETKEITAVHLVIMAGAGVAYLLGGLEWAIYFSIPAFFLEMVAFHILWIYRENRDHEHPIAFAVGVEIANMVIGILGAVALFVVAVAADHFLGIPFYLPLLLAVLGFFAYSGWKIKSKIPDDNA